MTSFFEDVIVKAMKTACLYIEKGLKAAVVTTAAVAFLVSGFLFCCAMKPSSAQASSKMPACHAHKVAHAGTSKTCDCCKIAKNDADQAGKSFEFSQFLSKHFNSFVGHFVYFSKRSFLSVAYQGPPRAASIPIYLQCSTFRL